VVMAIVPRAAALVYMRVLLCLQGLYLVFLGRRSSTSVTSTPASSGSLLSSWSTASWA
jgi:hypothetical protein